MCQDPHRRLSYAVTVVQDINTNGKMGTNFMGIPLEPVDLSRNPPSPRFASPAFEAASFNYKGDKSVNLSITVGQVNDRKGEAK